MTGVARDPVRVGVVGTGAIAQVIYLPILSEREDVRVVAVSDADRPKAQALATRYGVPRVLDDEALMADPEVEAVVICTPNFLHEHQATAALVAGKHVLVERPLALTPEGVRTVLGACRGKGCRLVVAMSHRFRPDVAAMSSFVAGGELGQIYSVRGSWLNRRIQGGSSSWRYRRRASGGGALMDLGIPVLDLCLCLVGYPRPLRVSAVERRGTLEVEDAMTLQFVTEGDIAFSVEASWSYFAGDDRHYARVMGTEGSGSFPPLEIYKQLGGRPLEVTPRQPIPRGRENPYMNAYRREIDHFLRAVAGEAEAPAPVEQIHLMTLIEAAYRSAREGREVSLENGEAGST